MSLKNKEFTVEDELRSVMESAKSEDETVEDSEVNKESDTPNPEPKGEPEQEVAEVALQPKPEDVAKPLEKEVEPPPVSLSGPIKAKWKELPDDVRAEWKKREDDVHRMMTAHDGELRLGRTIKEIATPYQAVIAAEGGTVEGAFKDLLNTAYVLRAGTPQQKAQVLIQAAQQFGVDLSSIQKPSQGQNPMEAMQREIEHLRQQADPNRIKSELQDQIDRDRIKSEIEAFAANTANVHFQAVRTTMGSLMTSGRAQNLQEAYEMAIWSDPSIRASLLKAQQDEQSAKRKAEMVAKKKASASVIGSPGTASPSAKAPQKLLEDDLREAMKASRGEAL